MSGLIRSLILLALLAAAGPVAAASVSAPEALRARHQREVRVAAIMHRLTTANTASCPKQERNYGLVIARLDDASPPVVRTALGEGLGLRDEPTALGVVPGSAAAQAGLRERDRITAINGTRWPLTTPPVPGARKAFWEAFQSGQQSPAMTVEAERDGQPQTFRLTGKPACSASVFLVDRKGVNATTYGSRIEVHAALEALLQDDAELAFVLGHELAHVILEHSGPGKEAQVKDRAIRQRIETEADLLGLLLMARGGYDPGVAPAAVERMGRSNGPITRLLGLHGAYMALSERKAFLATRAAAIRAQGPTHY